MTDNIETQTEVKVQFSGPMLIVIPEIYCFANTKTKQLGINLLQHTETELQGGARNVIPLIVHITHFYYYKSI